MSLRTSAALAVLALQLCNCAAAANKSSAASQGVDQHKAAIDEMDRRHTETMLEMGGGSM